MSAPCIALHPHTPPELRVAIGTITAELGGLSYAARYTLAALLAHAEYRNLAEPVYPGQERLASMLGYSLITIARSLAELCRLGYIARLGRKKGRGRFGVSLTYFMPLVAEIVHLPYHPDQVRQPALYQAALATISQRIGQTCRTITDVQAHAQAWFRFRAALAAHEALQRHNLPPELHFCLVRGVRYHDLIRWSKDLKKAGRESLITIVGKRRYWLDQARNLGGAMQALVNAALAGKKIREWGDWDTANQSTQRAPNPLVEKHKNQTYEIPATGGIVKVDDRGGVILVPADIRAAHEHRTLDWLDAQIRTGEIRMRPADGGSSPPVTDPLVVLAAIKAKLWSRSSKGGNQ